MQGDPSMFPMCLPPANVRWLHWDGRPRCKHRGVVCKAIRAYSPMSLGPDVCCTGPLTRKDLSPDRAKLATVVNREKPAHVCKPIRACTSATTMIGDILSA